jgi:serine/threonine-protein kinase
MTKPLLNNRYQVIQVLGAGGFGETFLAEDTHMPSRRRCVIKQLKPISNDPQTYQMIQQRFEREAATLEYLGESSEQIPKLYAYFSENGQFYLVQEWIQGQTLTNFIQAKGCQSETTVREIILSLLAILNYVHNKGIIHRDIKPDNIILRSPDSKPVLIDFGAVKETIRTIINSSGQPTQSLVIGTPGYMPSEQAVGRPVYSTDIYSLGLTAIYLLTGKHPQEFPTHPQTGEILWQDHAANISLQLATVLNQAIKPHASDRYSTASKMLYALESINYNPPQASTPTATISLSPAAASAQITQALPSPKISSAENRPKPAVIVGSLLIGSLIGGVFIFNFTRQPQVPITANNATTTASPTPTTSPTSPPVAVIPYPPADTPNLPPQPPVNPNSSTKPGSSEAFTPLPPDEPVTTETPTPPLSTPQPEIENQIPLVPPPEQQKPRTQLRQLAQNSTNIPNAQSVPAFPPGTSRTKIEAVLGKPKRDLKGLWGNTRAVTYKVVPNQIDLGYLFDRQSGRLRQTEAAFAQSVEPQVMQDTLNGMLGGQTTEEIKQGLQQIQQRQADNFQFQQGAIKGQIVRQSCDFIYISIWDADLHNFVDPSDAKQC